MPHCPHAHVFFWLNQKWEIDQLWKIMSKDLRILVFAIFFLNEISLLSIKIENANLFFPSFFIMYVRIYIKEMHKNYFFHSEIWDLENSQKQMEVLHSFWMTFNFWREIQNFFFIFWKALNFSNTLANKTNQTNFAFSTSLSQLMENHEFPHSLPCSFKSGIEILLKRSTFWIIVLSSWKFQLLQKFIFVE